MASSVAPRPDPCTHLDSFLSSVKQFTQSEVFKEAGVFIDRFNELVSKVQTKEEEVTQVREELVLTKDNLAQSEERWETEHPERIREILKIHGEETHELQKEKEGLLVKIGQLNTKIEEDKVHAADLEEELTQLRQELAEQTLRSKSLANDFETVKQENAKLKSDLAVATEASHAKDNQVAEHLARIEEMNTSRREMQNENDKLETKLRDQAAVLKKVQAFAPKLHTDNISNFYEALQKLWQNCYDAASRCFDANIAKPVLEDHNAWKPLKAIDIIPTDLPLPPSNEMSAKRVRTAALMAVLADSLVRDIFTSTYLLFDDEEIRNISFHLATTDAERERFLRRILNGTAEDKQKAVRAQRVKSVLDRVIGCVRRLVDDNIANSLHTNLSALLTDATELWSTVQRATGHFETDIAVDTSSRWTWRSLTWTQPASAHEEQDVAPDQLQNQDACLVLFPRVYVVTDSTDQAVFPGVILPRSETRAAKEEWDRIRQSNPALGRNKSMRSRRATVDEVNGMRGPFLDGDGS